MEPTETDRGKQRAPASQPPSTHIWICAPRRTYTLCTFLIKRYCNCGLTSKHHWPRSFLRPPPSSDVLTGLWFSPSERPPRHPSAEQPRYRHPPRERHSLGLANGIRNRLKFPNGFVKKITSDGQLELINRRTKISTYIYCNGIGTLVDSLTSFKRERGNGNRSTRIIESLLSK